MQTTTDSSHLFQTETALALSEARTTKAARNKDVGRPLPLGSKPLALRVRGNDAWVAESGGVIRRISLDLSEEVVKDETKTLQLYKGHSGPVTVIEFFTLEGTYVLISGSWDKSIRVWDTTTKALITTTSNAHSDFVKTLLVIPRLNILVSGGSDKVVRFWDLSDVGSNQPLPSLGFLSGHTRPVQCLALDETAGTLFSADSMGRVKIWNLERQHDRVKGTLKTEVTDHRTGVNAMQYICKELWTASTDETVIRRTDPLSPSPSPNKAKNLVISHKGPVKSLLLLADDGGEEEDALSIPLVLTGCEDEIHVIDTSTDSAETLRVVEGHAHNVVAMDVWNKTSTERWIVSASLDGTLRRWKLAEILVPKTKKPAIPPPKPPGPAVGTGLTEEEERELAELLEDG